MIEHMNKPQMTRRSRIRNRAGVALGSSVIVVFLLLILPIHMGLSAGIAAVSLLIFPLTTLLSLALIRLLGGRARLIAWAALVSSIAGLAVPQLMYASVARDTGAQLRFNPQAYVKFSGETDVRPTTFTTYKTVGVRSLQLAHYLPTAASAKPYPTVVMLHGGGWRYGDYLQTGNWPQALTREGFSVISVQYRLSAPGSPTWREAPQDVHDALIFIRNNSARLAIDMSKLSLLGQSAGGHLALLEAYRHHGVSSVVSLYAPVDLELDYQTSRDKSAELNFIGGTPEDLPERYQEVSPIHYVQKTSPRTLLVQGTRDDLVDDRNARALSTKLTESQVDHKLILLPLTGHSFENQHGGFATQITEQAVISFLRR